MQSEKHPDQPKCSGNAAGNFPALMIELLLIAAVVYQFNIEAQRFLFPLLCIAIVGFAIHAWLPMHRRLQFFAGFSISSLPIMLGMSDCLWVIGIAGLLIGMCLLPINFGLRIALLCPIVAILVFARYEFQMDCWPLLGSMFMFRLAIFLFDIRHGRVRPSVTWAVTYFFLFPNVCFPFFPVVDFATLRKRWYDADEWQIYQRGATWMVRGLVHLLLYRFVKLYLVPEPHELYDVQHLAIFMVTNYALYLQVSGQFHLITGILHLFGFNLPRTHNLFFLASSFSDIWKRINIYWKDLMAKIFFFPIFFALRKKNVPAEWAIAVSVLCVFVATWLLHSWQTFWLLGKFPITGNDLFVWSCAGLCVAVNIAIESQFSRDRNSGNSPEGGLTWEILSALGLSLRIAFTFSVVSLFWASWTKPGFLAVLWSVLRNPSAATGVAVVLAWAACGVAIGSILILCYRRYAYVCSAVERFDLATSAKWQVAILGTLVALASPWTTSLHTTSIARSLDAFRVDPAIVEHARAQVQGYYEDLNTVTIQAGPLISPFAGFDNHRQSNVHGFYRVTRTADAYQELDLIPNIAIELEGNTFTVNQFAMRDRASLTLDKPQRTLRIALVGSSIVMGYGVSDSEVFSRVLESRLDALRGPGIERVEVLNFGVGKQWAPHRLVRIQRKVVHFEPDVILYVAHQDEFHALASHAASLVAQGLKLPSQHLQVVVNGLGLSRDQAPGAIQARLQSCEPELLAANYRAIVDECRFHRTTAAWVYLPVPGAGGEDMRDKLVPIAKESGFEIVDLTGWAQQREGLFLTAEHHPNARGHQLIAEALLHVIQNNPAFPLVRR